MDISVCSLYLKFIFSQEHPFAYMGPGAGLGMIGSLVAVVVAVIIILIGLVVYPLRVLLHWRSGKKKSLQ